MNASESLIFWLNRKVGYSASAGTLAIREVCVKAGTFANSLTEVNSIGRQG